jgi:hypothetical protein
MSGVNPHRLGPASALKSTFAIEVDGAAISNQHVLMKSFILAGLLTWKERNLGKAPDRSLRKSRPHHSCYV